MKNLNDTTHNYYGMVPESEILKRKQPNVFIYQQITDECGIYEVRVGAGWDEKNLPAFKIPFRIPEGDFVMVKYPPQKIQPTLPTTTIPSTKEIKQAEMAL